MILETKQLTLKRGQQGIGLPDISLGAGESLALSGASGSGKTSVLLAMAGLVAPQGGEVKLNGRSLWAMSEAMRAKTRGREIGFVFADYRLIDSLSVMDNLLMACASAHLPLDGQRARDLLERLGVGEMVRKRADRLSQGQMQRVALARALMNRPRLLLADEPTAALDQENADQLMQLLQAVAQTEGVALIVATHDRRLLPRLGKVAFVFNNSKEDAA
ncbi:MAG: ATP-binding cassette domain-containing protein [Asticcacaulis sp.]